MPGAPIRARMGWRPVTEPDALVLRRRDTCGRVVITPAPVRLYILNCHASRRGIPMSAAVWSTRTRTMWCLLAGAALISGLVLACGTDPWPTESSLLAAALRSCDAPAVVTPPRGGGHPALTTQEAVPLDGTPFAVAISSTGVTYVTQAHAASAARADLPSTSFSTPFS